MHVSSSSCEDPYNSYYNGWIMYGLASPCSLLSHAHVTMVAALGIGAVSFGE